MSHDLSDTHILLIMSDENLILDLTDTFADSGATVHVARNRYDAMAVYWHLFTNKIIPRAVISKWWISAPDSAQYEFLKAIGRLEDCTALPVLKNAIQLDPGGLYIVYTNHVKEAKASLKSHSLSQVYICDRAKVEPERLVAAVSKNEITARYRLQAGNHYKSEIIDVSSHLEEIAEEESSPNLSAIKQRQKV